MTAGSGDARPCAQVLSITDSHISPETQEIQCTHFTDEEHKDQSGEAMTRRSHNAAGRAGTQPQHCGPRAQSFPTVAGKHVPLVNHRPAIPS